MENWRLKYSMAVKYLQESRKEIIYNTIYNDPKLGEIKIGVWVRTQRKSYTSGNLSDEQIRLLEEAGIKLKKDVSQLEKKRLEKGFRREQLEEKCGLPPEAIRRYENGARNLFNANYDINERIAKALDCSITDLQSERELMEIREQIELNKLKNNI